MNPSRVNCCLLVVPLVAVLIPLAARAQDRAAPSVAVFQIEPRGAEMTEEELGALSSHLDSQVAAGLGLRVVGWRAALAFLRTKDLYFCLDRRCQMEAEAALRVDYSLVVVINKMGQTCVFNATLYRSGSSASLRTAMQRGPCRKDAYFAAIDRLVASLFAGEPLRSTAPALAVGGPPAPVVRPEPQAPGSRPDSPPAAPDEPPAGPARDIDAYRRFYLVGGLEYSPAPLVLHEVAGQSRSTKAADYYGPAIGFDVRLADYLLIGAQAGFSFPADFRQAVASTHLGGLLPLSPRTCLVGRVGAGVNFLHVAHGQLEDNYVGIHAWLGFGLRHMFGDLLGLEVQLASLAGRERGEFRNLTLLRLQLQVGLVFGFGG